MSHLVLFLLAARDGIFFTDRWFLPSDTICTFISYGIICCFAWAMCFIKKRSFKPSFLILMEEKREGKKPNNEQLRTFNEINFVAWSCCLHPNLPFKWACITMVHIDYLLWKSNMTQTSSSLYSLLILTCKHTV